VLSAEDETKLRNMNDILQQKLVRRGVPLKAFSYGKVEPAAGGSVRQRAQIQEGIPQEKAREVVKFIKDSKAKVQASIQGDVVRVSGRDRDTLQEIIAKLKDKDFGIHMQFTNYRSN
jgi:cyclic-di-GMP-binding protein